MLQLVVRSKYNGHPDGLVKASKAEPIRQLCVPHTLRDQRTFFVQVSNICNTTPFQGCCLLHSHANVFSMSEVHFLASFNGEWDLFLDQTTFNETFILVPRRNAFLDCRSWNKWTYLGTCQASILRMDMEDKIKAWHLRQNQGGQRDEQTSSNANRPQPFKHHCHLVVYMDSFQAKSHGDVDYKHRAWAASRPKIAKRLQGRVFFNDEDDDDDRRRTYNNDSKVDLSHAFNYSKHPFWGLSFAASGDTAVRANTKRHGDVSAAVSRSKVEHNKEDESNNELDRKLDDKKKW